MISTAFLLSSLVVIIAPGPDAALILRLAFGSRGRAAPLAAAAGMITAGALQATVSVLGVSLLLTADSGLFRALQWVGAALLCYWGVRAAVGALRHPPAGPAARAAAPEPADRRRAYLKGLACTGTNPKVGLFLLAFLPQFIPPGQPPVRSLAVLCAVYLTLGTLWLVALTEATTRLATLLERRAPATRRPLLRWLDLGLGLAFIAFGIRLALGS
ncbi:Putative membrane protein [Kitasatospora sp. MMS16-BH015]|uniref:LysE family translocator n=1 Tax=Kitasatospora sp. MMS16-BH015 TaxID=2018025 RepID=UPI000CA2817C|nr:LysE family translocator [Kitasatospora sp. MMS16-BH015]AUG77900.1 Putative membrane protein [Kitasatospora sp. MMS16-BH015]